ncbi:TrmB family transcriptional regulator [Brevibacillus centrosporus]|uniref:Sugar-specific transcriptional regulator TrmB n=1 Tax=Brevibacillus centrosporus TaxID=54910 RepID=A0A1I3VLP6_9BACL|nr:helix-turn-helix domain-containing protein [Brevibacillus centrosporus]SFJ96165.1 Sugar-specific transcriptional regulator TrmB [Brevibacillus centrosporus]
MIDLLNKIGLTDLEARCYLTLHEEPNLSGYEVAKRVTVSRSNVYSALRSLTEKGACRYIDGEPVRYDAVPIEQLVRHLQIEFEQTTKSLIDQLKTPRKNENSFYNWQGDHQIKTAIHRVIANAKSIIVADLWSDDLHWVEEGLLEAEKRGVIVVLVVIGECQTSLKNVFVHVRSDDWTISMARKFSILCDSETALLGGFGGDAKLTALETSQPAIIEMLKTAFYHDIIMQHIERDFAQVLVEKYGEKYHKILDYYNKEKGWNI